MIKSWEEKMLVTGFSLRKKFLIKFLEIIQNLKISNGKYLKAKILILG